MSNNPSQRIVNFIGHLLPLYVQENVNGVWCARSLSDGTVILPIDEPEETADGFVAVHWQGALSERQVLAGDRPSASPWRQTAIAGGAVHDQPMPA